MQPAVIDTDTIKKCMLSWESIENRRLYYDLVDNLKKFHALCIDDRNKWMLQLEQLKNELSQDAWQSLKAGFINNDKLNRRSTHVPLSEELLIALASQTPDKLLLSENNGYRRCGLNVYDLEQFSSNKYEPQCVLYRIPKTQKFPADYLIQGLNFLRAYLQNARRIEICDPYLFHNGQQLWGQENFILDVLDLCLNIESVQFHWGAESDNEAYRSFRRKFEAKYPIGNIEPHVLYTRGSKDKPSKNHDRFILVDHDRYTIMFSTSFNNFKPCGRSYKVKKSCTITFDEGRQYID